ncbi:MAG: response regulator transcription factor [Flavobacteriaceae bacterium]|nr:response regulator transcription factor [Flavobacteriaceae bacterium]
MATKTFKYLLIEHLSLLKDGFHNGLKHIAVNNTFLNFEGIELSDIDANRPSLNDLINSNSFYFIWINLDFPFPVHEKYNTSISLLSTVKKNNPETHIVVTMRNTTVYSLRKVFKKINPHCILELIDCDQETIIASLNAVIKREVYYSRNVLLLLHKFLKTFETMDNTDYAILHELDLGTAITALPEKVHLSHSTILTKRTKLKELFNLVGKTDTDLIKEVKRQNFI